MFSEYRPKNLHDDSSELKINCLHRSHQVNNIKYTLTLIVLQPLLSSKHLLVQSKLQKQ